MLYTNRILKFFLPTVDTISKLELVAKSHAKYPDAFMQAISTTVSLVKVRCVTKNSCSAA